MQMFEEETEVPTREVTALFTIGLAACVFWVCVVMTAYSMGRAKEAQLTIDSLDRAEYAMVLLKQCTDVSARALHEVLLSDVYLWQRIVQLPPIQADR